MNIHDYAAETEYAASALLLLIWQERKRLSDMEASLQPLLQEVQAEYARAEAIANDPLVPDDDGLATAIYWDTYFGKDREFFHKDRERAQTEEKLAAHAFSVGLLASSLLQYARQGISVVHGDPKACPNGRSIGTQALKTVIWQARNQASHWEEGSPFQPVSTCFDALAVEFDPVFLEYKQRNLAFEIINLLDWKDYEAFKADLLSLG
jgi:hypothetical protein